MKIDKSSLKDIISSKTYGQLKKMYLESNIISREDIIDELYNRLDTNTYSPTQPYAIIDVNKCLGISRKVLLMQMIDYCVYIFCVYSLQEELAINRTEGTFGGWVLGNNFRSMEDAELHTNDYGDDIEYGSPYALQPGQFTKYWGEFNDIIKNTLRSNDASRILELDIANFYDSIHLDILENLIRSSTSKEQEPIVNLLLYFLLSTGRLTQTYRPQTVGIPQELQGDCSRILANYYLQDFDSTMHKLCVRHDVKYVRYADDQVYIFNNNSSITPEKVSHEASIALRKLGLNINSSKAKLWEEQHNFELSRGYAIFNLLDESISSPSSQTAQTANAMCLSLKESVDNNTLSTKAAIGTAKTLIKIGVNKLHNNNLDFILNNIVYPHIDNLRSYNLKALYMNLDGSRKSELLRQLENRVHTSPCNDIKYEAFQFARSIELTQFDYLKDEILSTRGWNE